MQGEIEVTTANSTEGTTIKLGSATFHPLYTYPIFGEKELWYGFKNPRLTLEFDAQSMLPLLEFTANSGPVKDDTATPISEILKFLPEDTCTDRVEWERKRKDETANAFRGEEYARFGDGEYQIYKTKLSKSTELLRRVRIFVLLFIDGANYIEESDDFWEIYFVFHREEGFVGFATVYPYFYYENGASLDSIPDPATLRPLRKRISQFVVLPPHQGRGVGMALYTALVNEFTADSRVQEITVEDPNELFDDMRDRADLIRLPHLSQAWRDLDLPIDEKEIEDLAKSLKLVLRQTQRCVEMAMLAKYPKEPREFKTLVKKRLWKKNYEGLSEFDQVQQREMLQRGYEQLISDHRRIIAPIEEALQVSTEETMEPPVKRVRV